MTHYLGKRDPVDAAHEIRRTISGELGFTVNVGVAENKLLAKMASDFRKPDRVHTLWREEIPEKMWPLPVRDLYFVGHASERKLTALGIRTIGDLAAAPPEVLYGHLKSHGSLLYRYANGWDDSEVETQPPPNKGYGNSLTTPRDVTDAGTAKLYLLSLAETVSARLRADGAKISVVAISVRDHNLKFSNRQTRLQAPTDLTTEICQRQHRALEGRQLGMFDTVDYDKQRRAEAAVDILRHKYGTDCVKRACFLESPKEDDAMFIDHMGGGISREKRSVDYSKEKVL